MAELDRVGFAVKKQGGGPGRPGGFLEEVGVAREGYQLGKRQLGEPSSHGNINTVERQGKTARLNLAPDKRSRSLHMHEASSNILYVLCSLPRSGKTQWAREHARQWGCPLVAGDALRRALYGRRFWLPADHLVTGYARLMVRALFVAGHDAVILDELNATRRERSFWHCARAGWTPTGDGDYPELLPWDQNVPLQDEQLHGDVVAWRRRFVVFDTPVEECLRRADELGGYNQLRSLKQYIRRLAGAWEPVAPDELHPGEDVEVISWNTTRG